MYLQFILTMPGAVWSGPSNNKVKSLPNYKAGKEAAKVLSSSPYHQMARTEIERLSCTKREGSNQKVKSPSLKPPSYPTRKTFPK